MSSGSEDAGGSGDEGDGGDDPRVCVVGAGRHSSAHVYPHLGRVGLDLVGVCDLEADRAGRNARRFGGTPYVDADAMLDAEAPNGVVVCVGPGTHADLARRFLGRDLPVYTEKPPAPSVAAAREVARAAADSDAFCMTAFKKRYSVAYERVRSFVESFPPSARCALSVDYASGDYGERDFLLDFAVHAIDLVGYLFGPVDAVRASARAVDDPARATGYAVDLTFASGAIGTLTLTDGRAWDVPTEAVEVTLDGGNFATVRNSSRWRLVEDGEPTAWREPPTYISAGDGPAAGTGHVRELRAFRDALDGDRDAIRSSAAESYRSMALFEAIRTAAETGATVDVEDDL